MGFSFTPDIDQTIVSAANRYGIDPNTMRAIAQIESAGDPRAQNSRSSAGGLYQFIDSTASDYGLSNRFDPAQAADAGARLARDNAARLRGVLGREPTAGELYLAHQQGGGGASRLLRDPNARAVDIVGADAVRLNGGNVNMTAGEFANIWMQKADNLVGGAAPVASGAPQGQQAATVPQDAFQAAIARITGGAGQQVSPQGHSNSPPAPLTMQDRLAGVGAALSSIDQGRAPPPIPQGVGGQIDLSQILDKLRSMPTFNQNKGLSL